MGGPAVEGIGATTKPQQEAKGVAEPLERRNDVLKFHLQELGTAYPKGTEVEPDHGCFLGSLAVRGVEVDKIIFLSRFPVN